MRPGLPLSISGRSSPATVDPTAGGGDPAPAPSTNPAPSLAALLAFVWLAGVVTVLSLAVARAVRLGRMLRLAPGGSQTLRGVVARRARSIGIDPPAVRVIDARVTPFVWAPVPFRPPVLVLPRRLVGDLSPVGRDALIAHELSHIRRRDHLVRYLELTVLALHWWNPIAYVARRQLRRAEERCCDDRVVAMMPAARRDYAESLLRAAENLAPRGETTPLLACGATHDDNFEERLRTIMTDQRPNPTLNRWQRLLLVSAAASLLMVFPTWAARALDESERAPQPPAPLVPEPAQVPLASGAGPVGAPAHRPAPVASGTPSQQPDVRVLEQRMRELEAEMRELRQVRLELEQNLDEAQRQLAREQATTNVEQSAAAEAERVQREAERVQRRHALESEALAAERQMRELIEDVEQQITGIEREIMGLAEHVPPSEAERATAELRHHQTALRQDIARLVEEAQARQQDVREAQFASHVEAIEDELRRMRVEGQAEQARHLQIELELERARLALQRPYVGREARLEALERQIDLLSQEAERLRNASEQDGTGR